MKLLRACDCYSVYCKHNPLDFKVRTMPFKIRFQIIWQILLKRETVLGTNEAYIL